MISIENLSDEEKVRLMYISKFLEIEVSELIKSYSLEQLEVMYDKQIAETFFKCWSEQNYVTLSMNEILNEFGGLGCLIE